MHGIRGTINRLLARKDYCLVPKDELGLQSGHHYLRKLFDLYAFDFVLDVSANNGQYARLLRQEAGYTGHIVSLEPIPELAATLSEQAQRDGNWSIHESALDAVPGTASFNIMAGNEFSSLMPPNEEFGGKFHGQHRVVRTIEVKVETLDAVYLQLKRQLGFSKPFIKLDTQGTELRILEGAEETLRQVPAVQMEVSFQPIYEGAPDIAESIAQMARHGFVLSNLFPNNLGHFPRLIEMDAVFVKKALLGKMS